MAEAHNVEDLPVYFTNKYKKCIFDDGGTGARKDCSLWQPDAKYWITSVMSDRNYNNPTQSTCVASNFSGDALRDPVGFTKIWTDAGSGAKNDRSLWRPIPPSGYVACGHVGIGGQKKTGGFSNSSTPSAGNFPGFKCVRRDLCVRLDYNSGWNKIWTDAGSGAKVDVEIKDIYVGEQHFFFAKSENCSTPEVWVPKALYKELVSNMKVTLVPRISVYGDGSGTLQDTYKKKSGFQSFREDKFEFETSVTASVGGAFKAITGSVDATMRSKINSAKSISFQEEETKELKITLDLSKPCFIYQFKLTGEFRGRPFTGHTDGILQTSKPVEGMDILKQYAA